MEKRAWWSGGKLAKRPFDRPPTLLQPRQLSRSILARRRSNLQAISNMHTMGHDYLNSQFKINSDV